MSSGPRSDTTSLVYIPGVGNLTLEQIAALPHDNAGPKLNIAVWILTAVAAVFIALRFYCKISRSKPLWWDDYLMLASWVSLAAGAAVGSYCVNLGYGQYIWDFPLGNLPRFFVGITVVATTEITASAWAKTSFAVTLLRFTTGRMKAVVWFILVSMNVVLGLSALFLWIRCSPIHKLWDVTVDGVCWPEYIPVNFSIFSGVYTATVDIVLAILPWPIIWSLQMTRKEKAGVAVAMSMGFIAGVVTIVKTTQVQKIFSPDIHGTIDLFIWAKIEASANMIGASIPFLRVLVREMRFTERHAYQMSGTGLPHHSQTRTTHGAIASASASASVTGYEDPCDNESDRSILGAAPPMGRNVQKSEVVGNDDR